MIEIPCRNGGVVLIDDQDEGVARQFQWYRNSPDNSDRFYAMAKPYVNGKQPTIWMHRLILDAKKGQYVDHVNHDGMDNRRCNIRLCSQSQNNANNRCVVGISGYRGVYPVRRGSSWLAAIQHHGITIRLGVFSDKVNAAIARDKAALHYFGEFATLNFPIVGRV